MATTTGDFLAYMRKAVRWRATRARPRSSKASTTSSKALAWAFLTQKAGCAGAGRRGSPATPRRRGAAGLPRLPAPDARLRAVPSGLGNRDTTIQKELSFSKTVRRQAINEDQLPEAKSPFCKIKLYEGKARVKAKLSAAW